MGLTYYALKNAAIGANRYSVGDQVLDSDITNGPLLVKRGIVSADGISGIPAGLATPINLLWDDMRVSLNRGTTGGDPPTMSTFRNGTQAYRFISDATNSLFFDVQLPHTWHEGSDIRPHIHWSPGNSTNTGDVRWVLEYTWADALSAFPATATLVVLDAGDGVAYQHQIASFGVIAGAGKGVSSVLMCRVYREGAHASDTFNANAFGLSLDFHIQVSQMGSVSEFGD